MRLIDWERAGLGSTEQYHLCLSAEELEVVEYACAARLAKLKEETQERDILYNIGLVIDKGRKGIIPISQYIRGDGVSGD